jgi:hypothetical protein
VLALVGCDCRHLGRALRLVRRLLVALEGEHEVLDGVRAEEPRDRDDEADPQPGPICRRHLDALLAQLRGPHAGVAALVRGDRPKRRGAAFVLLDPGQRLVQDDGVTLELEVLEAGRRVDGHGADRSRGGG